MKIRVYQINLDRDTAHVAYMNLNFLNTKEIDSSIYDFVYEADVNCSSLEGVFQMFNLHRPTDYNARSLSVSDVVEVVEDPQIEAGFYYCDSVGFERVEFDPTKAQTKDNQMRVVLCEPGKYARTAFIKPGLESLQSVVEGYIEAFYPYDEEVCIVCNEEGKINGLPANRAVYVEPEPEELEYSDFCNRFRDAESRGEHLTGHIVFTEDSFSEHFPEEARTYVVSSQNKAFQPGMCGYSIFGSALDGSDPLVRLEQYMAAEHGGADGWKIEKCYLKANKKVIADIICGTFLICDCSGSDFGSLSPEQAARYTEAFRNPERFFRINGEIRAVPYHPAKQMER